MAAKKRIRVEPTLADALIDMSREMGVISAQMQSVNNRIDIAFSCLERISRSVNDRTARADNRLREFNTKIASLLSRAEHLVALLDKAKRTKKK